MPDAGRATPATAAMAVPASKSLRFMTARPLTRAAGSPLGRSFDASQLLDGTRRSAPARQEEARAANRLADVFLAGDLHRAWHVQPTKRCARPLRRHGVGLTG